MTYIKTQYAEWTSHPKRLRALLSTTDRPITSVHLVARDPLTKSLKSIWEQQTNTQIAKLVFISVAYPRIGYFACMKSGLKPLLPVFSIVYTLFARFLSPVTVYSGALRFSKLIALVLHLVNDHPAFIFLLKSGKG